MSETPGGPNGPDDYLMICDQCGFKKWKSQMRFQAWNNLWVCAKHWEPRQPQDLLRARPDKQTVPVARPEQEDVFV